MNLDPTILAICPLVLSFRWFLIKSFLNIVIKKHLSCATSLACSWLQCCERWGNNGESQLSESIFFAIVSTEAMTWPLYQSHGSDSNSLPAEKSAASPINAAANVVWKRTFSIVDLKAFSIVFVWWADRHCASMLLRSDRVVDHSGIYMMLSHSAV